METFEIEGVPGIFRWYYNKGPSGKLYGPYLRHEFYDRTSGDKRQEQIGPAKTAKDTYDRRLHAYCLFGLRKKNEIVGGYGVIWPNATTPLIVTRPPKPEDVLPTQRCEECQGEIVRARPMKDEDGQTVGPMDWYYVCSQCGLIIGRFGAESSSPFLSVPISDKEEIELDTPISPLEKTQLQGYKLGHMTETRLGRHKPKQENDFLELTGKAPISSREDRLRSFDPEKLGSPMTDKDYSWIVKKHRKYKKRPTYHPKSEEKRD